MTISNNLADITHKIKNTLKNNALSSHQLQLMAVTKGQPIHAIKEAVDLGIKLFGENKVQEASDKYSEIKNDHPKIQLHLIGPLQTNKVKQALVLFDVIQTLDRPKLAEEIAKYFRAAGDVKTKEFFIQVNTGEEPQKAGIFPKDADAFIRYCRDELKLPVTGLMCIPPVDDVPAPHFALLREIAKRNDLQGLSMGMSDDYETAIRMGSTCIRLGRSLFGERPS